MYFWQIELCRDFWNRYRGEDKFLDSFSGPFRETYAPVIWDYVHEHGGSRYDIYEVTRPGMNLLEGTRIEFPVALEFVGQENCWAFPPDEVILEIVSSLGNVSRLFLSVYCQVNTDDDDKMEITIYHEVDVIDAFGDSSVHSAVVLTATPVIR